MVYKTMKKKQLKREFDYYHNKVEEMEQERETDRSWELQKALRKHKKMKLKLGEMGYTDGKIKILKPEQAHEIIQRGF